MSYISLRLVLRVLGFRKSGGHVPPFLMKRLHHWHQYIKSTLTGRLSHRILDIPIHGTKEAKQCRYDIDNSESEVNRIGGVTGTGTRHVRRTLENPTWMLLSIMKGFACPETMIVSAQ